MKSASSRKGREIAMSNRPRITPHPQEAGTSLREYWLEPAASVCRKQRRYNGEIINSE